MIQFFLYSKAEKALVTPKKRSLLPITGQQLQNKINIFLSAMQPARCRHRWHGRIRIADRIQVMQLQINSHCDSAHSAIMCRSQIEFTRVLISEYIEAQQSRNTMKNNIRSRFRGGLYDKIRTGWRRRSFRHL
jgi:hypothetical protein